MKKAKSEAHDSTGSRGCSSASGKRTLRWSLMLFLLVTSFPPASLYAQRRDDDAVKWLIEHNIKSRPDETVIQAQLFTIVLDKQRMVVKSGTPEQTIVIGFEGDVRMTASGQEITPDQLARGDNLVIILRRTGTVREIHKRN